MGKIILTTEIKPKDGFLYYCARDPKTGNVTIGEAKMA